MILPTDFSTYALWSGYFAIACLLLTILGFILKWGIRFRLVGITSFTAVLTAGLFGLSLGLYTHTVIPGAVRFALAYDNGANQVVITVPADLTKSEVEATLRQAASDLFSPGRLGIDDNKLTIRMRTILHPEPGISEPLYLGEVRRSLAVREDEQMEIKIFSDNVARLSQKG